MKQRIKRLLAVFLVVAAVANGIDFPEYEVEVSAVTAQSEAESADDTAEDPSSNAVQDEKAEGEVVDSTADSEVVDDGSADGESENMDGESSQDSKTEDIQNPDVQEENQITAGQESMPEEDVLGSGQEAQEIPQENLGYSAAASVNIPHTVEDAVPGIYYVQTYDDVLALQELSKLSSLEGCVFEFAKLNNTTNTWDLTSIGFKGFGSEQHPFRGTIQEYYESGITFKTNQPLFQYIGSGATLTNFNVTLSNATSGVANYLVVTNDAPVTYRNVILSGTVTNTNLNVSTMVNEGAAGALYGTVRNEKVDGSVYTLNIDGAGLSLSGLTVNACIAGGYVGQVKEKVAVEVSNASNLASAVYNSAGNGIALGGIVGKLCNGSSFTVTNNITVSNTVGYKVEGSSYTYSSNPKAVGGLIGACEGATVTSTDWKVTRNMPIFLKGGTAGGYIGSVTDSRVDISQFYLDAMIKTSIASTNVTACVGGVVGNYRTTGTIADAQMNIFRVGINRKQLSSGDDSDHGRSNSIVAGGVVGSIQGDHVFIYHLDDQDAEYPFVPLMGYDAYDNFVQTKDASAGYVGGVAGTVTGQDIEFYDIALSFDKNNYQKIAGKRLGGLVGSVGQKTKMLVTDITIRSMYVNCTGGGSSENRIPEYAGGLFGYVDKGTVISLGAKDDSRGWEGLIDLEAIAYTNGAANVSGLRSNSLTSKGYIAGAQTESLIYFEGEAAYRKNATALNPEDSVWIADYYNASYGSTLDDIGTYGGVYRNIQDENNSNNYVIDYSQSYGSEVTGMVSYADGAYTLKGDADALRLAIALNTFDAADSNYKLRFGSGCFQSGATGKTLLAGKYLLTGDLDFTKTGIYSLVRNDLSSGTDMKYAFTGSLTGAKTGGDKAEICMNIASKQNYAGLFPTIKDASFENLKLTGKLYYAANFGGLAYRAAGNLSIKGVDVDMDMRTRSYVPSINSVNYYGGYVGYYDLGTSTFSCENCNIAPRISNIRSQQIVGGLIGYVNTGTTDKSADNMTIKDVTIRSELTTDSKFMNNASSYKFHARMSGMIANVSAVAWDNQNAWDGVESSNRVVDATYAKVHMTNITVDGAKIDTSNIASSTSMVRATGGLLGYQWDNVEVVIDGDTGVKVTGNSTINSRGHVGGLFTTFSGKLDFHSSINLDSITMKDSQGSQKFSGLLVGDGRYALITLTAANYFINQSNVQVNGYMNFDEIVGVSCELAGNQVNSNTCALVTDYKQGGIVNIMMPGFKSNMTSGTYTSYVNRVSQQSNPYTRYYYNLFQDYQTIPVDGTTATLDSEEDLMLWHLYEYTSGHGKLKRFLAPYFVNASNAQTAMNVNGIWKLEGPFDMSGYSFYPTRVNGGTYEGVASGANAATIVLHAKEITNGETSHAKEWDQRTPAQPGRQHYMMHSGLFQNSYNFAVSGVTFRGTAANLGKDSGVLCAKTLKGGVTIKDITLDGVVLNGYDSGSCGVGLMLGHVLGEHDDNTVLKLDGVQTKNYGEGVIAAGALIGCVGRRTESAGTNNTEESMDFKVIMQHMDVEDRKGKVFSYASMICQYYYSSIMDSETNKIVLYTFTKQDAESGNVTYGAEMKDGVDYYDQVKNPALQTEIARAESTYNPYVHRDTDTSRYMFVNPRNGNLTTGCGTYEDPYVITDSRQLMNLFLYLTESSAYDEVFRVSGNEWKVNLVGNGSENGRCDVNPGTGAQHTAATYGSAENKFPTRDQLRTAYYQVTENLDLSQVKDMNDRAMNCDFVGIGTEKYPFAGVLVGKKAGETRPTITMPSTASAAENYGLFQYMKGGVVKDVIIKQELDSGGNKEPILIKQGGNGAGVAAVVLGGDNIIDNVKVDLKLTLSDSAVMARTGAYVGCVRTGGVILRNLKKDNISSYSVSVNGGADPESAVNIDFQNKTGKYKQNCQLIGWVQDGYVLGYLEGDQKATEPLLENTQLGITDTYIPLSYSFPIINGAYIDTGFSDTSKIKVTGSVTDGFTVTMHNGKQLEVAALGFNSDAFSIYDSGKTELTSTNAYDYRAICRKADYSQVGCGYTDVHDGSLPTDYVAATTEDDENSHYPYIYKKYMDFTALGAGYKETLHSETDSTGITATLSYLNWTYKDGNTYKVQNPDVVTTYQLDTGSTTGSTDYDLSVYGRSFRGFGALYHKTYSQFKSNFDGANANVKIQMERDWDSSITTTGMFNGLETMRETDGFTIQNLNIKDSYFNNANAGSVGGALTGYMKGIWNINNVRLTRSFADADHKDVENKSHTGGLVGVIRYYSKNAADYSKQQIRFTNCRIQGSSSSTDAHVRVSSTTNVGGIVGYVEGYTNSSSTNSYYGHLFFTDCKLSYADVTTTGGNAGGFIGRAGNSYGQYVHNSGYGRSIGTVTITATPGSGGTYPVSMEHSNITVLVPTSSGSFYGAGGLVGSFYGRYDTSSTTITSQITVEGIVMNTVGVSSNTLNQSNSNYTGGIGGILGGAWANQINVNAVTIRNSKIDGIRRNDSASTTLPTAGVVGAAYATNLSVSDVELVDTDITSYGNSVAGVVSSLRIITELAVQNVNINHCKLSSERSSTGGVIGMNNIRAFSKASISGVKISQSDLYAGCTETIVGSDEIHTITNNVSTASVGGLMGYSNQQITDLIISDIQIGEKSNLAGYCAGGLIGVIGGYTGIQMKEHIYMGCQEKLIAGRMQVAADSDSTTLYGKWRNGALIGSDETTREGKSSAAIRVYNTRVGGYGTSSSNTAMAAGLVGYVSNHNTIYDDVAIHDCLFAVTNSDTRLNAAAGTLWAYMAGGTHRIYRPVLENNSTGYVQEASHMATLEAFQTLPETELGLVYNGNKTNILRWNAASVNLSEQNVGRYSYGLGNYIGTRSGGTVYILRPELTFGDSFTGNRPAIDVGNTSGNSDANYATEHGYGYPYNYRTDVHIVYFEPKNPAGGKSNVAGTYLSGDLLAQSVISGSASEDEYLFSSLDTFAGAYQDANDTGKYFLSDYNLNVTVNGTKVINANSANTNSYYNMLDSSSQKKYIKNLGGGQVQCLYADGVGAQDLLESMVDILTNSGGGDSTNFGGYLTIKAVSAKITSDGKIVANPDKNSSIEVVGNKVQYRPFSADEPIKDAGGNIVGHTITLLIYQYGWTGADNTRKTETIYIPVFVVERISLYNDLHILEGEQYSINRAKDASVSYQGQVTVAHDSTYTLYSELAYSSAREKEAYRGFIIKKKLQLWQQQSDSRWALASIPGGLQFTLVDVSTGKAYYYTSTGNETEIQFTQFNDKADGTGTAYSYQQIGSLTTTQTGYTYGGVLQAQSEEFGLERFFIYVEPSQDAEIANSVFKWSISTEETADSVENFLDQSNDYSEIEITWMPGLDISFKEKQRDMYGNVEILQTTADVLEGSAINQDQKVTVTAAINIMADQEYWNQKAAASSRFIDSENNGKYLDVAIYLIDKATGEYVTLPPGTYLRLNGDESGHATTNQSVTYAYQQWDITFPLAELTENVQGWNQDIVASGGSVVCSNTFTLEMDFATANIDDYVGKSYDLYMELRRTSDPEYPLEGSKLDSYSERVESYGNKELATSLEVKDIRDLGINTYKEKTHEYTIPFTTKLDFANMIYNDADVTTCANSDYLITYRIKKKVQTGTDASGNPIYEYRTVGSAGNPQTMGNTATQNVSELMVNNELKLSLVDAGAGSGTGLIFNEEYGLDGREEPVYQMIKRFSKDDIRDGTDGVDYLLTWDLKLTVDTTDIENFDLSNYMVEVTVLPFDPALTASGDTTTISIDESTTRIIPKTDSGSGIGSSLKDYYIFTIGKLKTDL